MDIKKRQDLNVINIDELFEDMDEDRETLGQVILSAWLKLKDWRQVSRQRRELRDISDQLLKDIGISRADAIREADRTFWDKNPNFDASLRKRGESNNTFESESTKLTCCVQS